MHSKYKETNTTLQNWVSTPNSHKEYCMPPPKYGGFKQATFQMSQMLKQLQMIQGCIGDGNKTGHLFKATIAYI